MTRKERKYLTAGEKVKAVKKVLVDKKSISEVCEELGIAPSAFYLWQKQLFEGAEAIFIRRPEVKLNNHTQERIAYLEAKLREREEAVSELLTEYVALKKNTTGPA